MCIDVCVAEKKGRQKKKGSVKKIKRGDEDVRPAGGKAALYLLGGNLEMFNWPLHRPQFFEWSISSISSPSFSKPLWSFLQELAAMWSLRGRAGGYK